MVDGFLIGLLFAVGASLWVYYDAKKRNIVGAGLYAWGTLLVLIVGLPCYLYERSKHPIAVHSSDSRFCVSCGHVQIIDAAFCPYCGAKQPSI